MSDQAYESELLDQVHQLDDEQLYRLLNYARLLAKVPQMRGESGKSLIASVGMFGKQDLEEMQQAIEEDCERIDWGGWE
jgi:hypothetical protein